MSNQLTNCQPGTRVRALWPLRCDEPTGLFAAAFGAQPVAAQAGNAPIAAATATLPDSPPSTREPA